MQTDGKTCQDINECLLDPAVCRGGSCVNTEGSFFCRCPPGLSLDQAGTTCLDLRTEPCYLGQPRIIFLHALRWDYSVLSIDD